MDVEGSIPFARSSRYMLHGQGAHALSLRGEYLMIGLIAAALLQTGHVDVSANLRPDPRRLTESQSYVLRGAKLQEAPNHVAGIARALCGRTEFRRRSSAIRFVYVQPADGSAPEIFEENDMPEQRERFWRLWRDLGCR